jgi:hypothetical protein
MPYVFSNRVLWNHVGFHRRHVWVNVYVNRETGEVVHYLCFDKKKDAVKSHNTAFLTTKLFCYRMCIRPNSKFRPDTAWKVNKKQPIYNRELSKAEMEELGIAESNRGRRRRRRQRNKIQDVQLEGN